MNSLPNQHYKNRKLTTLVENKTTYNAKYSELNIFETHQYSEKVKLKFNYPIVASMLTGKKVMHLKNQAFDFLPGESLIMPPNNEMIIDFPTATKSSPTQCLALGIDSDKVEEVLLNFNQEVEIDSNSYKWELDNETSHLINNNDVNQLIKKLISTFTTTNKSKDFLVDLMIQELIVRLLQTKAKSIILEGTNHFFQDSRIGMSIQFIKKNLTNKNISVELLAKNSCMSISNFHKKFKNTIGISPIDYINSEKIKFSKKLIAKNRNLPLSEIAFKTGYNSVSYFIRKFKEHELITPSQFRRLLTKTEN